MDKSFETGGEGGALATIRGIEPLDKAKSWCGRVYGRRRRQNETGEKLHVDTRRHWSVSDTLVKMSGLQIQRGPQFIEPGHSLRKRCEVAD